VTWAHKLVIGSRPWYNTTQMGAYYIITIIIIIIIIKLNIDICEFRIGWCGVVVD
jgi:hypothetical protein